MRYAKLGRDGTDVQCARCSVKLGAIVGGPLERMVAERGGPALGTVLIEPDKQALVLVAGYTPRDDLGGLWVQTKRSVVTKRAKFAHGDGEGNGVLEFPARVLCYRCGETCVIGAPA